MISAKDIDVRKEEVRMLAIERLLVKIENRLVLTPITESHLKIVINNIDFHSLNVLASKLIDVGYRVRVGTNPAVNSYDVIISWSQL